MIEAVITGGQTGCDQSGWRAAKAAGIMTFGWMPASFTTEDATGRGFERHPEFADLYGAREHDSPSYPARRKANLHASDAAIVFNRGPTLSHGTKGLLADRKKIGRQVLTVILGPRWTPDPGAAAVADWIRAVMGEVDIPVLMVAGNRESSSRGIGAAVERILGDVFRMLSAPG